MAGAITARGFGVSIDWKEQRIHFLRKGLKANRRKCPVAAPADGTGKRVVASVETIGDEIVDVVLTDGTTNQIVSLPCIEDALWAIRLGAQFKRPHTSKFSIAL